MVDLSIWKKAWALLDKRERRNACIVLGVIIIGAISSALMVGSVMPFLAVLAEPSRIEKTSALAWVYDVVGFETTYGFLVSLGVVSFVVIVLSSAIQIARTWAVSRFAMMRMHSISHRLLSIYLAQPYEFFLNRHSSEMGPRILAESQQVVNQFLRPAAELIASFMTTLAIVGLLLWVEPVVATVAFVVLGSVYGIIHVWNRHTIRRLGQKRVMANRSRFRLASESLNGIKDIKLLGRERSYLERFEAPSRSMAQVDVKVAVFTQVPQFALQAVALGGIILLCLVLIDPVQVSSGAALGGILPILGVFAFAGQRLMPELSKLYQSLVQIQAGSAAVEAVHEDLVLRSSAPQPSKTNRHNKIEFKKLLRLDGISYRYPGSEKTSINEISLTIRAGEKIGIVGGTGAGKTTLGDIILGLLQPSRGKLVVDEVDINSETLWAWMNRVGYVPQDIFMTDASIAENIALGITGNDIDYKRIFTASKIARIDRLIEEELPYGYDTQIGEKGVRLSGGQRQRIGIARAMYRDADLIVFDEATSALDNLTEYEVMDAITSLPDHKTVIMIAHRLSTLRGCDRIIVIEQGRLVGFDSWDNLSAENEVFKRIALKPLIAE